MFRGVQGVEGREEGKEGGFFFRTPGLETQLAHTGTRAHGLMQNTHKLTRRTGKFFFGELEEEEQVQVFRLRGV